MADIQSFIQTYGPAAAASAAQLGTTPANVLGHWGLETGWGKSVIPGTNNLGNIKSTDGSGVAATDNQTGTRDNYQAFSSPQAFAQGYTSLLSNPRYSGVVGSQDPASFATALKSGGYAEDPAYVNKLVGAINAVQSAGGAPAASTAQPTDTAPSIDQQKAILAQQVTEDYANGTDPMVILTGLLKSKLAGPDVQAALSKGVDPTKIISVVGGAPLAQFKASDPAEKVKQQGFLDNVWQGVKNAGTDMSTGAQQISASLSGNQDQLNQLNAAEAQREADPAYHAQMATGGSKLGSGVVKALPALAAAAVPEVSIPMAVGLQGAVGAAQGALTPTTGDGQRLGNIVKDGALGAGGATAGVLAGKGLSALASKALGGDADATARVAQAQAQGLPVNAASASGPGGFWRRISEGMPENSAVQTFQNKADQAIASKVAEGLGLQGYAGPIDGEMINAATPGIKTALDSATNVTVTLPKALQADLAPIIQGSTNPLTEGIAGNSVVQRAATNLLTAARNGTPVAGGQLQELNSELKALIQTPGVSASEKQAAGNLVTKIHTTLTDAMTPDQAAAFNAANGQYANLKAVQNMVTASNGTGTVLPRQMLQAVKTGRFRSAFIAGDAPYQDLASTASDLYGPASGKGLASVLAHAANSGADHGMTAAIIHPAAGVPVYLARQAAASILGKLATSENPAVVRLLTGAGGKGIDPTTAAYIAKALGGVGAVAAQ